MDEDFQIPVAYKGKEELYTARLLQLGYIYKIEVDIADSHIHFEKDDSGNWRALLSQQDLEQNKHIDRVLVEQLVLALEEILGS